MPLSFCSSCYKKIKYRFYYLDFMKHFSQSKNHENKENIKKEKFDASNYILKEKVCLKKKIFFIYLIEFFNKIYKKNI